MNNWIFHLSIKDYKKLIYGVYITDTEQDKKEDNDYQLNIINIGWFIDFLQRRSDASKEYLILS
jgi:hypothetical protein